MVLRLANPREIDVLDIEVKVVHLDPEEEGNEQTETLFGTIEEAVEFMDEWRESLDPYLELWARGRSAPVAVRIYARSRRETGSYGQLWVDDGLFRSFAAAELAEENARLRDRADMLRQLGGLPNAELAWLLRARSRADRRNARRSRAGAPREPEKADDGEAEGGEPAGEDAP